MNVLKPKNKQSAFVGAYDEFNALSPEEAEQIAKQFATARECAALHLRVSEKQSLRNFQ